MNNITEQALKYYTRVTKNSWHKFFDEIDEALAGDLNTQDGSIWYTHILLNTLIIGKESTLIVFSIVMNLIHLLKL